MMFIGFVIVVLSVFIVIRFVLVLEIVDVDFEFWLKVIVLLVLESLIVWYLMFW